MSDEFDLERAADEIFNRYKALEAALAKLELDGGPKLGGKHYKVISRTVDFPWTTTKEANRLERELSNAIASLDQAITILEALPMEASTWLDYRSPLKAKIDLYFDEIELRNPMPSFVYFQAGASAEIRNDLQALLNRIQDARAKQPLLGGESGKRGRPTQAQANMIAMDIANIYVELRGEEPKFAKSDQDEPTSIFCRAVADAFKILSIKSAADGKGIADFRGPCERAVEHFRNWKPNPAKQATK